MMMATAARFWIFGALAAALLVAAPSSAGWFWKSGRKSTSAPAAPLPPTPTPTATASPTPTPTPSPTPGLEHTQEFSATGCANEVGSPAATVGCQSCTSKMTCDSTYLGLSGQNLHLGSEGSGPLERSIHFRGRVDSTNNPRFYADWKGWIDGSIDGSGLYHKLFVPTDGEVSFVDLYPQVSAKLSDANSTIKLDCGGGATDISKVFAETSNKYWWFKLQMDTVNGATQYLQVLSSDDADTWDTFDALSCTQATWAEIKGYRTGRIPAANAEINIYLDQMRVSSAPLWPPFLDPTPTPSPTPTLMPEEPIPTPAPPTYQNSFEFAGCANEKGSNSSVVVAASGDANCDYTADGVVDRSQSMRAGAADWLTLSGAIDTTGKPNLYTQLSVKIRNTVGGTAGAWLLFTGGVGGWDDYPRLEINTSISTRRVTLVCSASASDYVPLSANVQYTIQLDARLDVIGLQNMRVYRNDTQTLVDTAQCISDKVQPVYTALAVGYTAPTENGADVALDNLLASYYPLSDPFGVSFPTPTPTPTPPGPTPTSTSTPTITPTPAPTPTPHPSGGPVAVITTNLTSGPSPLAVEFNGISSSHPDPTLNTNKFGDLYYRWDYGDPTSGTWTTTGKSRNKMTGPLGAHVFEPTTFPDICTGSIPCKRYTVTLTLSDPDGKIDYASVLITVYDPNNATYGWGGGKTVCISKTGGYAGCPAVADHEVNAGTFQSILTAKIAAGYRRILFEGGQTWNMTGQYSLGTNGPGLIGSYGGSKFTISVNLSIDALLLTGDYWRIQDVIFAGYVGGATGTLLKAGAQNIGLLLQRTIASESSSFRTTLSMHSDYIGSPHRHIFLVDNDWARTAVSYNVYIAPWGLSVLGNYFRGSASSHTMRLTFGEDILISNNHFGPGADNVNTLNLRDKPNICGCTGEPFCGVETRYYLIQDNYFECNAACTGAVDQTCLSGNVPVEELPANDYIWERNLFTHVGVVNGGGAVVATAGPNRRFVFRNNIVDQTGWTSTYGYKSGTGGARINNNTCYRSDVNEVGPARCIEAASSPAECRNNVMYAPNWTGIITVRDRATCTVESNNFDNGVLGNITYNPFVDATPTDPTDFIPASPSQILNTGANVPSIYDDLFSNCRSVTFDAGAIERGAIPCQ